MQATPPKTRDELALFVRGHFHVRLPGKPITPGHSTPLEFIWDALSRPGQDMAVWANRGGLKTFSSSVVAAMEFLIERGPLHARVLAGSEEQARVLYDYWAMWCKEAIRDRCPAGAGRSVTMLTNGDLELVAASQKQVRGPKVQRLFRDEVDEIDPEVYAASVGMLSRLGELPSRTIDTSTWHRAGGPMGRLVAEADLRGVKLHKWNIWEVLERCPPGRHEHGRGCGSCRLARACLAKEAETRGRRDPAVGIAAECDGVMSIDDAVRQFTNWSMEQWQAEAECRRPALHGMVYAAFDRCTHVRADLARRDELPCWRAIDWGYNNFVCLWIQADKHGRIYVVDELHASGATTADNARRVRAADDGRRVEATYCDPAGAGPSDQTGFSDVEVFAGFGVPCTYSTTPWARDVHNGINLVRAALRPAEGPPRLFVSARCRRLIEAFEDYRLRQVNGEWVDEPIKPQPADHAMDALRYFFVNHCPPLRTETRVLSYV